VREEVCEMKTAYAPLGLGEQELREAFETELSQAMRVEGNVPTVHAIAHSFARVMEFDHLRIAEQLERAGVRIEKPHSELPHPYGLDVPLGSE
jgi:hypothetical protein